MPRPLMRRIVPGCVPDGTRSFPRRLVSTRGDQLVEVTVHVPTSLTPEQKVIVEQLAAAVGQKIEPVSPAASFLDRLKNLFQ